MSYLLWAIGVVAGAFLGLIFTILLQDKIAIILVKVLRIWVYEGERAISGKWYTYYVIIPDRATSASAKIPSGAVEVIRLRRAGSRVTGSNVRASRDYIILGVLRDGCYLTGTWRDLSEDRYHWGGFQLWWLDSGAGMVGKFVGKDSKNHINHGIWLWSRTEGGLYNLIDWAAGKGGYKFDSAKFRTELDYALAVNRKRPQQLADH
jgi:hypothetical protein